jgi:hypothetical protein
MEADSASSVVLPGFIVDLRQHELRTSEAARVKLLVVPVMQPLAEYRWSPNAS